MSADPTRRRALAVLLQVGTGRPLDEQLDAALAQLPDAQARAFLAELVKGTLRWQGRYDHLIRHFSRRRQLPAPALLAVLRMSLHQMIGCAGVPAYAAVHQGAELCREAVSPRLVPYVNGLLRTVATLLAEAGQPPELAVRSHFPDPARDPDEYLARYHSHPRWLVERWRRRYGFAACEALCTHDNRPALLTLHVLAPGDAAATAARLEARGLVVARGRWSERALLVSDPPPRAELQALLASEPGVLVQDEGAQVATSWLAAGGVGGRLLDLCAAPGGKAFHLRALLAGTTELFAMDCDRGRLALMVEAGKRIEGAPLPVLLADGVAPPWREGVFDAVLLDGPCSGTGVLRHHPEGRWRLRPGWLKSSGARLRRLAATAGRLLAPGGRLMYVTCSLEPEENEEVVAVLRAGGGDTTLDGGPAFDPDPHPDPAEAGAHQRRWLPQETGTDGFFAARLRRRAGER